jgi:hypothetical protein
MAGTLADWNALRSWLLSHILAFHSTPCYSPKVLLLQRGACVCAAQRRHQAPPCLHESLIPHAIVAQLVTLCAVWHQHPPFPPPPSSQVADFGMSIKLADGQSHVSGVRRGTPLYMAPGARCVCAACVNITEPAWLCACELTGLLATTRQPHL